MMVRPIYLNSVPTLIRIPRGDGNLQNGQPIYPSTSRSIIPFTHIRPHNGRSRFSTVFMPVDLSLQSPFRSNVKFKEYPLYVTLNDVIPPTSLIAFGGEMFCERYFSFRLEPDEVSALQNNANAKIHMRIGILDTDCEQSDIIHPSTCIKVNGTDIRLPCPVSNSGSPGRIIPKYPLDITFAVRKTDEELNSVYISWVSNEPYVFAINLVQRQVTSTILKYLRSNGIRSFELTKKMIMEQFRKECDSDISTVSLKGSLICPVGKVRIEHPCRALTCDHFQCFDGKLYVEMNSNNPKWICPICHKPAFFEDLIVDGLFLDIISKAPNDCIEVEFHEDGSWAPLKPDVVDTSRNCVTILDESLEGTVLEVEKPIEVTVLEVEKPIEVVNLE